MKKYFILALIILAASIVYAQETEFPFRSRRSGELIYTVIIDSSWKSNSEFAHRNGMDGFFYPGQYTMADSPIGIMTASIVGKESVKTFSDFVNNDLIRFQRMYGRFEKEEVKITQFKNTLESIVYKIEIDGVIQYLAYFETKKAYILVLCQIFEPSDEFFDLFHGFLLKIVFE